MNSTTLSQLAPFGFLGLFQLIGGLAAGSGLRKVVYEHTGASTFLIIWGFGFGGIPTLIGYAVGASLRQPVLALLGPLVFLSALAIGFIILPWLVQLMGVSTLMTLAVGGGFTVAGSAMLVAILRYGKGTTFIGFAVAGFFTVLGLWLCWTALSALYRGQSLDTGSSISARHNF